MDGTSPDRGRKAGSNSRTSRPPSGLRRLSPAMLATGKAAEGFGGLPEGIATLGLVLAAFKAAAPYLGFGPRVVHAVDWLFRFTQKQDWVTGSRPIVWPSASMQCEALGLSLTRTKALNRYLVEMGLISMRDSPNGKRYGRRDPKGRIIEAYGFDLSPLAARQAEFLAAAEAGRALREEMRRLRRRVTVARNGLLQILETAAELDLMDEAWQRQAVEARRLAGSLQRVEGVEALALAAGQMERRQREARERLESQIATAQGHPNAFNPVQTDPKGADIGPLNTITNQRNYLEQDTVIAPERSKSGALTVSAKQTGIAWIKRQQNRGGNSDSTSRPEGDPATVMRMSPDELLRLTPRLKPYLRSASPSWPEIVDAADWLRHDLGVSKPLWGEACLAMGREQAAVALAIVSAKPAEHFRSSPGGYFFGMVKKAKTGELNLARTIWGLRQNATLLISTET